MGQSTIGATHLIKYKRDTARPSRATGKYKDRNNRLPGIGYATYVEYLKSPEWAEIRARVLTRRPLCSCADCPRKADQVHHWDYHDLVLLGLNDSHLLSMCDQCHGAAEFDGTRKRTLREVQHHLWPLLRTSNQQRIAEGNRLRNEANKSAKKNAKKRKKPK